MTRWRSLRRPNRRLTKLDTVLGWMPRKMVTTVAALGVERYPAGLPQFNPTHVPRCSPVRSGSTGRETGCSRHRVAGPAR